MTKRTTARSSLLTPPQDDAGGNHQFKFELSLFILEKEVNAESSFTPLRVTECPERAEDITTRHAIDDIRAGSVKFEIIPVVFLQADGRFALMRPHSSAIAQSIGRIRSARPYGGQPIESGPEQDYSVERAPGLYGNAPIDSGLINQIVSGGDLGIAPRALGSARRMMSVPEHPVSARRGLRARA